jgi:hypothetical protein
MACVPAIESSASTASPPGIVAPLADWGEVRVLEVDKADGTRILTRVSPQVISQSPLKWSL